MPCNAVATIRTKLALPESLQAAVQELTKEQATRLYCNILAEYGNEKPDIQTFSSMNKTKITANGLMVIIRHDGKMTTNIELEPTVYRSLGVNIVNRFTEQTIKAAGLVKQAKAINLIKARFMGSQTLNAPNGATIINLDI